MEQRRDELLHEINQLAELDETTHELESLRDSIEARRTEKQQTCQQLDEELTDAQYEKTKKLNEIRREQELALVELETEHKKKVLELNEQAGTEILANLGKVAVDKTEWGQPTRRVGRQGGANRSGTCGTTRDSKAGNTPHLQHCHRGNSGCN